MSAGMLEVWRQPDGFWRWRYRNPSDGTDLISNEGYPDRHGAILAARTAYPGVRGVQVERPRPNVGRWLRRLAALVVIVWLPRKLLSLFKATVKLGVVVILPRLLKRVSARSSPTNRPTQ